MGCMDSKAKTAHAGANTNDHTPDNFSAVNQNAPDGAHNNPDNENVTPANHNKTSQKASSPKASEDAKAFCEPVQDASVNKEEDGEAEKVPSKVATAPVDVEEATEQNANKEGKEEEDAEQPEGLAAAAAEAAAEATEDNARETEESGLVVEVKSDVHEVDGEVEDRDGANIISPDDGTPVASDNDDIADAEKNVENNVEGQPQNIVDVI